MDFLLTEGRGRDLFVRYWTFMAEALTNHPFAIAAELFNEPMTIKRNEIF